ncbi:hypothetical protein R4Z10_11090 [Niallia sp. XMNu-256]|uniref:hypothetical protein n=1 Tax=Niallia sp. XMNu-256 TaxID=3082444 RepID=UPI0030CD470B
MRKEFGLAFIALFFLSLNAITGAYAVEDKEYKNKFNHEKEIQTLIKEEEDISGDGKLDQIEIKGIPYDDGSAYLREIYLVITGSNGKKVKKELDGGYEPTLKRVDLNHDGIDDLLISIPTGGSGGLSNFFIFSFKDFQLTDLGGGPEPLNITSQFLNNYKAVMTIDNTGETFTFDLKNRKKDYNRLGLYTRGMLNEPRELMVDPYSTLKPIVVKEKGETLGLKAIQQVSGAYHADGIAFVESTWYYENGKWNLIHTKVMNRDEINKKRKK